MPNYIANRLKIIGTHELVHDVLDFIKIEKSEENNEVYGIGTIDFNKITPCPPWVFNGFLGREHEEKYGKENCWYEWNKKNWGTKWNAFNQTNEEKSPDTICFETANNGVPNLIKKIAWIFPNVELQYEFADEELGCNVGRYNFKDTEIEDNSPESRSKDAYELAFELKDINLLDYGYIYDETEQNYVCVE